MVALGGGVGGAFGAGGGVVLFSIAREWTCRELVCGLGAFDLLLLAHPRRLRGLPLFLHGRGRCSSCPRRKGPPMGQRCGSSSQAGSFRGGPWHPCHRASSPLVRLRGASRSDSGPSRRQTCASKGGGARWRLSLPLGTGSPVHSLSRAQPRTPGLESSSVPPPWGLFPTILTDADPPHATTRPPG